MVGDDSYYALICDPKRRNILTTKDGHLPVIKWDGFVDQDIDVLCNFVQAHLNARFGLIYLRAECESDYQKWFSPTLMIFEINRTHSSHPPKDHVWVLQEKADEVMVKPPTEMVNLYLQDFKKLGLDVNGKRLFPYSRPGWFEKASSWFKKGLRDIGYNTKSVAQIISGSEGCVLCAKTDLGALFYMKASPPGGFNNEVTVSCVLANFFPNAFIKPIAADEEKRWMVFGEFGTPLTPAECSMTTNQGLVWKVLCEWAAIQKKSIPLVGTLLELGVPVFDGNGYKTKVNEMLSDPDFIETQWEDMNSQERMQYGRGGYKYEFQAYMDRLCRKLSKYKVPLTIAHRDLSPNNVIADGMGSFKFTDLTFTCVTFPFLDAIDFMVECEGEVEDLDFFLELWTEYESIERLRELMEALHDLKMVESRLLTYALYANSQEDNRRASRHGIPGVQRFSFVNKYL